MKNKRLGFDKTCQKLKHTSEINRDEYHSNKFTSVEQICITHANGNKVEPCTKISSRNIK